MAVSLSPVGGAGWQFFDNNGNPLSGGKLYTYEAGTTTPEGSYTTSSGATAHANPIILDSAGRVSGSSEVWLTDGQPYKLILKTSTDVQIWSVDNISGVNDFSSLIPAIYNSTGDGANVTYTLPTAPRSEVTTNVYVSGVYQQKNTYTMVGTALTFSEAPPLNTSIEVTYF